ncbi:pre-mRNA-splicing factor CWC25 homolog [Battus philenor]|uniref:pre-mRNA-splicing factor CWC25 homolog n=1 Tax=Battus philenor TaxID=42288 RepID=UPI0035CE9A67
MGGGDLNAKKAWHPSTLKNQERVWKAEQAAAEEKKRIMELQRERAEERDREELNKITKRTTGSSSCNEDRLHWMYDKPDKKIQHEDYLLGKSVDANHDQVDNANQDIIPAVARRVVGSSMLAMSSNTQVDLARKLREDPLLLIKERERAARAALLNNPLQRRRLTELLRKEQNERKELKNDKKTKKKHDIDNILAEKLNSLGAKNGLDLKALLASDESSSSSSSSDEDKHKKKKKEKKSKKKKMKREKSRKDKRSESPKKEIKKAKKRNKEEHEQHTKQNKRKYKEYKSEEESIQMKRHRSDDETGKKQNKFDKNLCKDREEDYRSKRKYDAEYDVRRHKHASEPNIKTSVRMSKEEKAAKLAEMAAAGAQREVERGRRVAKQIAEKEASEKTSNTHLPRVRNEARALPDSLESRIHSNRHYIQRNQRHMNEHFARR